MQVAVVAFDAMGNGLGSEELHGRCVTVSVKQQAAGEPTNPDCYCLGQASCTSTQIRARVPISACARTMQVVYCGDMEADSYLFQEAQRRSAMGHAHIVVISGGPVSCSMQGAVQTA